MLDQTDFIHYSYNRQQNMKLRKLIIIFCAVLFLVAYQSPCFSIDFKEQAEKYREKGFSAQKRGEIPTAISFYKKAISLDPTFAAAYNDLGILQEMTGKLDLSAVSYQKAISLDKYYLPAYSNLASLYEKAGRLEDAALLWKKRVDYGDPEDYWTKLAKERLERYFASSEEAKPSLRQKEIKEFNDEIARKKLETFNKNVAGAKEHFERGKRFFKEKLYFDAKEEFQKALAFTPDNPTILEYYNKAKKLEIDQKVKTHSQRGLNYYEAGATDQAREEFKNILSVIPDKTNQ